MFLLEKQFIPAWLWEEVFSFMTYPDSSHEDISFVLEKEGWGKPVGELFASFARSFHGSHDYDILFSPITKPFKTRDTVKWVSIVYLLKGKGRVIVAFYIKRLNADLMEIVELQRANTLTIRVKDVMQCRDHMTAQPIILDL